MTEKQIEDKICNLVAIKHKGLCLKLELNNMRGFPDRTVILPGGRILFLEIKKPGGKLSQGQKLWLAELSRFGFPAYVVESVEDAEKVLYDC